MIDIKVRLKQLMDERGLTMYALAKQSNMSWNTIKNFYTHDTKPTVTTLAALCDGLGITMAQFFEESENAARLTAEQQHLINRWNRLTEHEKQTISDMLDIIIEKQK